MKIHRILLAATLMVAMVLSSCQQKAGQQKSSDATAPETDEFAETVISINPGLRDPSTMMVALEMAGADYMEGLVVPMENVDFYARDETHAAIALGIYTVDIAYLVTYNKTEEAIVKYERARKLANTIGLESSYEQRIFEDYITSGANPDSLRKHLTLTAENVDRELTLDEKARSVTLYITGEFIEKMYIGTQVIKRYPTDLPEDVRSQLLRHLMIAVTDQEAPLDNLIELLNQIRKEEEGERFMAEMNKLKQVYVEANFKEMIANWTPDSKPTGDYLPRITEQIELLRESLVATEE
jgi:hypothetical protein